MSEKIAHFPENQILRNGRSKYITLQSHYVMVSDDDEKFFTIPYVMVSTGNITYQGHYVMVCDDNNTLIGNDVMVSDDEIT